MLERLTEILRGLLVTGDVTADAPAFLLACGRDDLANHSRRVALEAVRLAKGTGVERAHAETAAWLHDIGVLIPTGDQVKTARHFGIEPLPEEMQVPFLLHQRLSAELAHTLFGVTEAVILDAIRCHTTLRSEATALDKVLFVADKLSWDPSNQPAGLPDAATPLDQAVLGLLKAMSRSPLQVVHPWLRAAYEQVTGTSWEGVEAP